MSRSIVTSIFLILILATTGAAAPAPPANLQGRATAAGVQLSWDIVRDAEQYDIFRAKADVQDTFGRIGNTKETSWTDTRATAGREYMYYLVSRTARSVSDKSEIIVVRMDGSKSQSTSTDTGDNPGVDSRPPQSNSGAIMDFAAKSHKGSHHTFVFVWDPGSGQGTVTHNVTEDGRWRSWSDIEPFTPPNGYDSTCQFSFAAQQKAFSLWMHRPSDGALWYSTSPDIGHWDPWARFHDLPKPPNNSKQTRLLVDATRTSIEFVAYNTKDGSLQIIHSPRGVEWGNWEPFGTLLPPPGSGPDTVYGFGEIAAENGARGACYMYAYTPARSTLHIAEKPDGGSWNGWTANVALFAAPPMSFK